MASRSVLMNSFVWCSCCGLCQFRTLNGSCRRCRRPLSAPLAGAPPISVLTDTDVITAIGSLTRSLRKGRKLSQFRLAKAVGSTRSNISKIERGLVVPTIPTVARLASALGIDIVEFFLHLRRQLVISDGRIECGKGQKLSPSPAL